MDENYIRKTSEDVYRKRIKVLVRKAAFQELLEKKKINYPKLRT